MQMQQNVPDPKSFKRESKSFTNPIHEPYEPNQHTPWRAQKTTEQTQLSQSSHIHLGEHRGAHQADS